MMDARSEAQLASVMPELADKVRTAAANLAQANTYMLVVSGLRTAAEQNALYAQGRTTPGHVVTYAKAGESMHNYGLAVDVVPYLSGEGGAPNWDVNNPQYREMVSALKTQGLTWGGDWHAIKDFDHFQIGGLPATPSGQMISDYIDGPDLATIWANMAAGKYGTVTA